MMMEPMPSSVTYGELRRLLLNLGFEDQSGEYLVFHHAASCALVRLALHELSEAALDRDLVKVGAILELKGLLAANNFEHWELDQKRQPLRKRGTV